MRWKRNETNNSGLLRQWAQGRRLAYKSDPRDFRLSLVRFGRRESLDCNVFSVCSVANSYQHQRPTFVVIESSRINNKNVLVRAAGGPQEDTCHPPYPNPSLSLFLFNRRVSPINQRGSIGRAQRARAQPGPHTARHMSCDNDLAPSLSLSIPATVGENKRGTCGPLDDGLWVWVQIRESTKLEKKSPT